MESSTEYKSTLSVEDWKYLLDNGKYTETDTTRSEALQDVQEWLKENPHIGANPNPRNLVRFLRHSKYNLDVCKQRIKNCYLLRSKAPEWFGNRDPTQKHLQELLELGPFLPLLKKDSSKRTTIIARPTVYDPSIYSQHDLMKLNNMIFELAMEKDETMSIYGANVIVDMSHVRLGHIQSPAYIKKSAHACQDCYPVSPKRFDFLNAPIFIKVVIDLFRHFLSAKLRSRIFVHGKNLDSLHENVSPEILPEEYGGSAGNVQELIDYWKQEVLRAKDWFLEEEKYRTVLEDGK